MEKAGGSEVLISFLSYFFFFFSYLTFKRGCGPLNTQQRQTSQHFTRTRSPTTVTGRKRYLCWPLTSMSPAAPPNVLQVFGLFLSLFKVKIKVLVTQSCPILCDPMDCSLPGFSVHGFSRKEYWSEQSLPFPRDRPNPRDETQVSHIAGRFLTI